MEAQGRIERIGCSPSLKPIMKQEQFHRRRSISESLFSSENVSLATLGLSRGMIIWSKPREVLREGVAVERGVCLHGWLLPEASKRKEEDTSMSAPIGRHSPQPQHDSFLQLAVRAHPSSLDTFVILTDLATLNSPYGLQSRLPSGFRLTLDSLLRNLIHAMVILGGLELVAAGVILHKYNKGKEREKELEREQDRRSRERRHDRKHHHHRRDSPPQHMRKEQSLYPPQSQVPRAQSAPPPGYAPNWQLQPTYYPSQSWQPQQNEKTPAWHPQPTYYPLSRQAQAQAPAQPQHQPNLYPSHHDDAALSDLLQRHPPHADVQPSVRTQPRPTAVAPPDPSYAELSADGPRNHNAHPNTSPHVSFAVPGDGLHDGRRPDPPPAYQPYVSEERE